MQSWLRGHCWGLGLCKMMSRAVTWTTSLVFNLGCTCWWRELIGSSLLRSPLIFPGAAIWGRKRRSVGSCLLAHFSEFLATCLAFMCFMFVRLRVLAQWWAPPFPYFSKVFFSQSTIQIQDIAWVHFVLLGNISLPQPFIVCYTSSHFQTPSEQHQYPDVDEFAVVTDIWLFLNIHNGKKLIWRQKGWHWFLMYCWFSFLSKKKYTIINIICIIL